MDGNYGMHLLTSTVVYVLVAKKRQNPEIRKGMLRQTILRGEPQSNQVNIVTIP
jgi:hypothetical protein